MGAETSLDYRGDRDPGKRLWDIVRSEREGIKLILVYGAAVGVFSLVVPIAAQSLVNTVAFNSLLQPILVLTLIVFVVLGAASALRLIQVGLVERIQQRVFTRIALDLAYRLPRVRIEVYDRHRGTELVNRFFEVLTVQKSAALMLLDGLAVLLQAGIGLVLLGFYHPLLLAFDVLLIISMSLVVWLPAGRATSTSVAESKAKYRVAAWLEELARNPVSFKFSSGSSYALRRADEATVGYLDARQNHFKYLRRQVAGTLAVQVIASALLLGIGSVLVIKKQLTLGQLVAAELIVTTVVSGFAKFGKYLESFYDLLASVDKLGQLFDLPLEKEGGEPLRALARDEAPFELSLKRVGFSYGSGPTPALTDVTFRAAPGARIGINGTNGSGKSTFLDVAAGLRTPTFGAVEINGVDLRETDLQALRSRIALVRKAEIFDGTVLDNVRVGREDVSIEEVRAALDDVGLLDEITAMRDGLMSELSGSQSSLSAGQAQRLALARAIASRPRLLLLDEALESIDGKTKTRVLKALTNADAPWTLVLATHNQHELSFCEEVLRLDEGRVHS